MTFRKLLGLAANRWSLYAHRKRGGQMTARQLAKRQRPAAASSRAPPTCARRPNRVSTSVAEAHDTNGASAARRTSPAMAAAAMATAAARRSAK